MRLMRLINQHKYQSLFESCTAKLVLEYLSEYGGLRGGFNADAPSGGDTCRLLADISVCAERPSNILPFRLNEFMLSI